MSSDRITDEMVDAAWGVLREEWDPPYMVDSSNYLSSPDDPPPGPERVAALAALRAADDEADRLTRDSIRRALAAALGVSGLREDSNE